MSRLSVFWPDEIKPSSSTDERMILPFPQRKAVAKSTTASKPMDVITRARVLFENRRCTDCGYPVVEPIELPDSATNRSGLAIPGTATLIGFRCCGCQTEWPV